MGRRATLVMRRKPKAHHVDVEVTMSLSSSEEVYRYIGGALESAFADPVLGPRLSKTGLRVRIGLVDPDCVLTVDAEHHQVCCGRSADHDPSLIVGMNAETANRYCQGTLDVASAVRLGAVAAMGNLAGLLELEDVRARFAQLYVDRINRDGRADLLVS